MALFLPGDPETDEPFKQHLTPLEVSSAIQSALSATWLGLSKERRSATALESSARRSFESVEHWWMNLDSRSGAAIVEASQNSFGPPPSAHEEAKAGTLTMESMATWIPSHSFSEALFWAWLLQPEETRTPSGTVELVRNILERQIRNAEADIDTFRSNVPKN